MSKSKAAAADKGRGTLVVRQTPDEADGAALARTLLDTDTRHGMIAGNFVENLLGNSIEKPTLDDYAQSVKRIGAKAERGDLAMASRMLSAQAQSLDVMFTQFARRAALNMGEYLNAGERYARLALKAQTNCRTTLEALARLHQPREQTVRHVYVGEGGQAIVADEFHHHGKAAENGVSNEQSHAPRNDGETASCAALPRPDPEGNAVPVASGEGKAPVPDARRD